MGATLGTQAFRRVGRGEGAPFQRHVAEAENNRGLIRPRLASALVVNGFLGRLIHTTPTQAGTNARDTRRPKLRLCARLAWATLFEAFSLRQVGASAKFAGSGGAIIGTFADDKMYGDLCAAMSDANPDWKVVRPTIV